MVLLYVAAVLTIGVGLVHSILGKRYLISRLPREEGMPRILGSRKFSFLTLRFAWHITTIEWFGFAGILVLMAHGAVSKQSLAMVIAATFLVSGLITLVVSRGRHFAWVVFLAIGAIALYEATI